MHINYENNNDGKNEELELTELRERYFCELCEQDFYRELSERDFYPPQDGRFYSSGVFDIPNGDAFYEYAEYFLEEYENHLFDCNN